MLNNNIIEEDAPPQPPEINHAYKVASKLYDKRVLNRNTRIRAEELGNMSILRSLALGQQEAREKIGIKGDCFLISVIKDNLELRSSIDGWRSDQTVQILQAGSVQQNTYQEIPQGQMMGQNIMPQKKRGLF